MSIDRQRVRGATGQVRAVVGSVVRVARAERVSFLAAAVAYYGLVSVFPLSLLALSVASLVGGQRLTTAVLDAVGTALTPGARGVVYDALVAAPGRGGATVVGLAVLLWSGLKVFRGLDVAFAAVYDESHDQSFLGTVGDAVIGLTGVAVAVGTSALVRIVVAVEDVPLEGLVGSVGPVVVLTAAFLPLYYRFPEPPTGVRHALPGAVVAAVGWSALGTVFGWYAAVAGRFSLYGVVGGLLLLVTWLYVGAMALLVGATLNAVLSERAPDRQLQQAADRQ